MASKQNARKAKNFDYLLKIMLVGDSGVGKTCVLVRYTDDAFREGFIPTVGIDFKVKTLTIGGKKIKLQIWDTAGQERFHSITQAYFRGAKGILLLYDITREESFMNVRQWIQSIDSQATDNTVLMLVGNKCDLDDERVVKSKRGEDLAAEFAVEFMETSAKTNHNIDAVFTALVKQIKTRMDEAKTDGTADNQSEAGSTIAMDGGPSTIVSVTDHSQSGAPAEDSPCAC